MSDDQLLYFVEKNGTKIEVFLVNVNNSLSCFTAIKQFLKKYFVEALIVKALLQAHSIYKLPACIIVFY
jgi:hypothetical protein